MTCIYIKRNIKLVFLITCMPQFFYWKEIFGQTNILTALKIHQHVPFFLNFFLRAIDLEYVSQRSVWSSNSRVLVDIPIYYLNKTNTIYEVLLIESSKSISKTDQQRRLCSQHVLLTCDKWYLQKYMFMYFILV